MKSLTPKTVVELQNAINEAVVKINAATDEDEKNKAVRTSYAQIRALQEGEEETDYSETPRAAMQQYIEDSGSNLAVIITAMGNAVLGVDLIPNPLPEGIVFVPTGGSGSGS